MDTWVTVSEATELSIYSREHISYLIRKGLVNAQRRGAIWLVDTESLKQYEEKMIQLGPSKHKPKAIPKGKER